MSCLTLAIRLARSRGLVRLKHVTQLLLTLWNIGTLSFTVGKLCRTVLISGKLKFLMQDGNISVAVREQVRLKSWLDSAPNTNKWWPSLGRLWTCLISVLYP